MVDIASNIMLADERVLWMAQREAKACTRIVQCLQKIAMYRLANGAQVYSTVSMNLFIYLEGVLLALEFEELFIFLNRSWRYLKCCYF